MTEPFLQVQGISASYGNISALDSVSLSVPRGAIVALLGANGAGKSTTLNVISRFVRPTKGSVRFDGQEIHQLSTDDIVRKGLVQVPEGRQIFRDMSVQENLEMGAYTRRDRAGIHRDMDYVCTLFPRLKERFSQKAATLSGGEQQMLAMARAIMSKPRMILLDEPSMGLAPLVIEQIFNTIQTLNREEGMTILLVEQNVKLALSVSSYAYILENGEVVLEGKSEDLKNDEAVQRAYLGS
ncbi:MAG: ABC transporter ATP-binding protein [Candidimonas sp.]|jgi:branched-chain amino acid transport system ATP-binding protein